MMGLQLIKKKEGEPWPNACAGKSAPKYFSAIFGSYVKNRTEEKHSFEEARLPENAGQNEREFSKLSAAIISNLNSRQLKEEKRWCCLHR